MMDRVIDYFKNYLYIKKGKLLRPVFFQYMYLIFAIIKCLYHEMLIKDYFNALGSLLRYERDIATNIGEESVPLYYNRIFKDFIKKFITNRDDYLILESYQNSKEAKNTKLLFTSFGISHLLRIKYHKKYDNFDRQGDLLILKPFINNNEKGVLLIQYDETIKRFASIYDIQRLAKYYRFVIEPSTFGYQNPIFFLLLNIDTDVIFQSQFKADYDYISKISYNFYPIRLGAGDWTNFKKFKIGSEKEKMYDLIMIANWLRWKRHKLLFSAMSRIECHIRRIALIGYAAEGRSLNDIILESKEYGIYRKIDFYEKIPHVRVRKILQKSKVGVMLSKEEGANRGIYECFFSNVPVILTDQNKGVNRDHINAHTGVLANDSKLSDAILYMLENYQRFNPRTWALKNTGYINSTNKLNEFIKNLALENGEVWTQDIFTKHNSPHARYANKEEQKQADVAFGHLEQFLR